jgi:hypothetical protein
MGPLHEYMQELSLKPELDTEPGVYVPATQLPLLPGLTGTCHIKSLAFDWEMAARSAAVLSFMRMLERLDLYVWRSRCLLVDLRLDGAILVPVLSHLPSLRTIGGNVHQLPRTVCTAGTARVLNEIEALAAARSISLV